MAKQKKKATQISSIDKMVGRMIGIEIQNPVEFRQYMDTFKEQYKDYSESLGLHANPFQPIKPTKENQSILHSICTDRPFNDYVSFVRTLLIGYWNSHRVIYSFSQETIDFMDNVLHIQDYTLCMSTLQKLALQEPICVEIPPGGPFSKAIVGKVCFFHDNILKNFKNEPPEFCCYATLLADDGDYVGLNISSTHSVKETLQEYKNGGEDGAKMLFLQKLVAYIGYMRALEDAPDLVFQEESIRNGIRYRVCPVHTDDILSDETTVTGWRRVGLAPVMGYLLRSNMLRDYQEDSNRYPEKIELHLGDKELGAVFMQRITISWEMSRNFYSFTPDVAMYVTQDNLVNLIKNGIASDLLDYMPYHVLALTPEETNMFSTALIAQCTMKGGLPGVFISVLGQGNNPEGYCFLKDEPLMEGNVRRCVEEIGPNILTSLCLFMHILQVLKKKNLRQVGNRKESRPQQPHPPAEIAIPEAPILRQGGDVNDTVPITMFDLTKRTIKRVPQKEVAHRNGWKVVPHIRRRHPHRYWVGKGKERHLETRWLESMRINRKQEEMASVTVHNVGL